MTSTKPTIRIEQSRQNYSISNKHQLI